MNSEFLKTLAGVGSIPLIVGLTQLSKGFILDTRYYPVISVVAGIILNILIAMALGPLNRADIVIATLQGTMAGLAASGLYSTGATYREGSRADKRNRVNLPPTP